MKNPPAAVHAPTDRCTDAARPGLFYSSSPPREAGGLIGLPALMEMTFHGSDLQPVAAELIARVAAEADDAEAMLDLSYALHLTWNRELALRAQHEALALSRRYHVAATGSEALRVLVLMTPGDLAANMPIEFLLHGTDIAIDMLFIAAGEALPDTLPAHDVACIGVCESDATRPLLEMLVAAAPRLPRPTVNRASRILALARESLAARLVGAPGCTIPPSRRIERAELESVTAGTRRLDLRSADGADGNAGVPAAGDAGTGNPIAGCSSAGSLSPEDLGADFPIICRPVGSHAGRGLERLDDVQSIARYLQGSDAATFVVSPFVDYRNADGLYRKYRIAFIAGRAYPVHMAISERWMIHYLNADMTERADHRGEEQRFFATFDETFAVRHAAALAAIDERVGLDCFSIDCAETADARLLVFEADNGNAVHAMDPLEPFGYKRPHMLRLFAAFRAMLIEAAASPALLKAARANHALELTAPTGFAGPPGGGSRRTLTHAGTPPHSRICPPSPASSRPL